MKFSIAAILLAAATSVAGQEVISLHGSGTTNPSKCYWHIMDKMQIQAKNPIKMTYRGVGSGTGQKEFIGNVTLPDNDFGSGDIPIKQEDFDLFEAGSILHLPIVIGAISFFHSVPTGSSQLSLTPCVLAKIFKREITEWTDSEILELNPDLELPDGYAITVARRVLGSSSTSSITAYLNTVCPEIWPETMVGSTIEWPTDTSECEGSGGMTDCIVNVEGTIGYIDSGHGHSENLQEIELRNADNVYITSKEAGERGGVVTVIDSAGIPDSLDESFADVNYLNKPGADTWPIVAMSYIYVRKDLTYMPNPASQTLLKAFLQALYSDDYVTVCEEEFGFNRITGDLRDKALLAIDELIVDDGAPVWTFENDTTADRVGQADFVISVKRNTYSALADKAASDAIASLSAQLAELQISYETLQIELGELAGLDISAQAAENFANDNVDEDQVNIALGLAAVSFSLWMLAIVGLLVKFFLKV